MIEKKEKKGGVTIYYVDKDYGDDKLEKVMDKKLKRSDIKDFIHDDADVYTKEGKLLLRFRKNKLSKEMTDEFYENVINFAVKKTANRGSASGSKSKNVYDNPKIMSNILGYFDKLSPIQKLMFTVSRRKFFLQSIKISLIELISCTPIINTLNLRLMITDPQLIRDV